MAGYTLKQLKRKSYEEIQEAFERTMKEIETFMPMYKEVEGKDKDVEGSNKRKRAALEQESSKKQKMDEDSETAKLKQLMKVVQDDEIALDAIPLATKPPTIVDLNIVKEGKKSYYLIIRADGQSRRYITFAYMLKGFDREDLETLWALMKKKYGANRPEGYYERVLYGDLKTMFDPHVEDEVWKLQHEYKEVNIKFRGGLLGIKGFLLLFKITAIIIQVTAADADYMD
ncbi:hypothetical protein Tco_1223435 [Tanacetum coccineum]